MVSEITYEDPSEVTLITGWGETKTLAQMIKDHQAMLDEIISEDLKLEDVFPVDDSEISFHEGWSREQAVMVERFRNDPRRFYVTRVDDPSSKDGKRPLQEISGLRFKKLNLSFAKIKHFIFVDCIFDNCEFENCHFYKVGFVGMNPGCEFNYTNFIGCLMNKCEIGDDVYSEMGNITCKLYLSSIESHLISVKFYGCEFNGSTISNWEGPVNKDVYLHYCKVIKESSWGTHGYFGHWTLDGISLDRGFLKRNRSIRGFHEDDLVEGINGVSSTKNGSTAYYELPSSAFDQLSGDIDAILRNLERARNQLGYVFVLGLSAALLAFSGLLHLTGSVASSLKIPLVEVPLTKDLVILIALPAMLVLLYEISSFMSAARESSSYLKTKEDAHALASFPWLLTRYVPYTSKNENLWEFPEFEENTKLWNRILAWVSWRWTRIQDGIKWIVNEHRALKARFFRSVYCFGPVIPFAVLAYQVPLTNPDCDCTGARLNPLFVAVWVLVAFAAFQAWALFRVAQSFQLPVLIDKKRAKEVEDEARAKEERLPKAVEGLHERLDKITRQIDERLAKSESAGRPNH